MNDFKYCIAAQVHYTLFDDIDWEKIADDINNMPVNVKSIGFTRPIELMRTI